MSKTTLTTARIMASFERRLNSYVDLEMTHCGHQEGVDEAQRSRDRMMKHVEKELDALARKAGVE